MSRTAVVLPGTPPPIPDSFVPCRIVIVDGRSPRGVVRSHLHWGPGPHPEDQGHGGRVRRTFASVDKRQGILRTLNSRYGLRGVRVGEASHPGPASKRRRTQRFTALQRSRDSGGESSSDDILGPTQVDSDSKDEQPRSASVPPDVMEMLEHDVCELYRGSQSSDARGSKCTRA